MINLTEVLVLSKLDYANALFYNIPKYLQSQMQRVLNATTCFTHRKYAKEVDILALNCLPIHERNKFSSGKLAFKALRFYGWLKYLPLPLTAIENIRSL